MPSIVEAISKAIDRYNHYRSPEVTAELIEVNEGLFVIDFHGPFCKSCGVFDYFDDLIYELKGQIDIRADVAGFESTESETIRVRYALRAIDSKTRDTHLQ